MCLTKVKLGRRDAKSLVGAFLFLPGYGFQNKFLLQSIAMKLHKLLACTLVTFAAVAALASSAQAGIVINGTRVVFPGNEREVTVKLTNAGKRPSLVQAWMDKGDAGARPETISVPFTLSPPIFRMDPNKGQTVRMISTGEAMPQDKESIFWFNILEIPPKPELASADENALQIAFRTRIKVFYRPQGLAAADVDNAPARLTWKIVSGADGKGDAVEVKNPTPFYITVSKLNLQGGGKSLDAAPGMVEPFGVITLAVADAATVPAGPVELTFHAINDYGGEVPRTQAVTR